LRALSAAAKRGEVNETAVAVEVCADTNVTGLADGSQLQQVTVRVRRMWDGSR